MHTCIYLNKPHLHAVYTLNTHTISTIYFKQYLLVQNLWYDRYPENEHNICKTLNHRLTTCMQWQTNVNLSKDT